MSDTTYDAIANLASTMGSALALTNAQVSTNTLAIADFVDPDFESSRWHFTDFYNAQQLGDDYYGQGTGAFGVYPDGELNNTSNTEVDSVGVATAKSKGAVNSGYLIFSQRTQVWREKNLVRAKILMLGGLSTRLVRTGLADVNTSGGYSNAICFNVSGLDVVAHTIVSGTDTASSSATLVADTYYYFDIIFVPTGVRFVISKMDGTKVFDYTATSGIPTIPMGHCANFIDIAASEVELAKIDYLGRGLRKPPFIKIPA